MRHPTLQHPGRWIWLFLLVPVALGVARLHFDVEIFDLLPTDLPAVQGLQLYQRHFANARQLIIAVKAPDPGQVEAVARAIAAHLQQATNLVASAVWEPPWLESPQQSAELMAYLWFNQRPAVFGELTNRLAPDKLASTLTATREELATSLSPEDIGRLSYDPFGLTRLPEAVGGAAPSFAQGQNLFSSPDGRFRILFVQARQELRSYRDCALWLKAIQDQVPDALTNAPSGSTRGLSIGYTGRPALVSDAAAGMQHDIVTSVGGTAGFIAVLFWLAHRRVKPMLWLLTLLGLILGCALALGGLIFGAINVVSMGFAAILLGLAVDYAVVHYQEALAHPNLSIGQIRHAIAPSILWAAVTTITAFLVLNLGGLPGLGQLGTLVGLGVALAASIMIFEFLPPLFPGRTESTGESSATPPLEPPAPVSVSPARFRLAFATTAGVPLLCVALLLVFGRPPIDPTAKALSPRHSPAYDTAEELQAQLNQQREPLWLMIGGHNVSEIAQQLEAVQPVLTRAVSNHLIASFTLPLPLWPRPDFQAENRPLARQLAEEGPLLHQAAQSAGFAPSAMALTDRMLETWRAAAANPGVFWPTNPVSDWILSKVVARSPTNYFALALVNPAGTNIIAARPQLALLERELPARQVWLSGWELLGNAIFSRVKANMWRVVAPMIILVLLSLWFAFRRLPEILLSLGALALSGLCLLTIMRLANWSWNLLDLMAVPLVLGTGVDYSIFMQLALRRYGGNLSMAYNSVGRALLLCGGTAIAAFGSLAWSSNAGMASLGQVCAVGIACNVLIAIFLAPLWWKKVQSPKSKV